VGINMPYVFSSTVILGNSTLALLISQVGTATKLWFGQAEVQISEG
jgi:hypothetical protein